MFLEDEVQVFKDVNVCINPYVVNAMTRDIIPGKIIRYLSCAKPVLATPLPGMVLLLSG